MLPGYSDVQSVQYRPVYTGGLYLKMNCNNTNKESISTLAN